MFWGHEKSNNALKRGPFQTKNGSKVGVKRDNHARLEPFLAQLSPFTHMYAPRVTLCTYELYYGAT